MLLIKERGVTWAVELLGVPNSVGPTTPGRSAGDSSSAQSSLPSVPSESDEVRSYLTWWRETSRAHGAYSRADDSVQVRRLLVEYPPPMLKLMAREYLLSLPTDGQHGNSPTQRPNLRWFYSGRKEWFKAVARIEKSGVDN